MGSLETSFRVLDDTMPDDTSLPAFMVSKTRGFLPRMDPIVQLPPDFDVLESILQRMPIKTKSGAPGLLAQGRLGDTVVQELLDLTDAVDKHKTNLPLVNALYRDYSFLASAYLLEPCHQRFVRDEPYGLGRSVLPAIIARPIARCAEICGFKPFMEYAGSYALYNYRLQDPALGLQYSNLRLIRAFEHGLDPSSSEAGFVLVHVDMVRNSGPLVAGTMACLDACAAARTSSPPSSPQSSQMVHRRALNSGLSTILASLRRINAVMETMWAKSKPASYTQFRTFIFGITSQSMFPSGVVYEGVGGGDDGEKPMSFRGESGANDSMIPLMDNLLAIRMPDTPLTEILRDFRQYRPSNHREFLGWVYGRSRGVGFRGWALGEEGGGEMGEMRAEVDKSRRLWLGVLDQVRDFRWRHWCFAREYILKRTSHPTATGGSPIVTWLPNQLQAVLGEMDGLYEGLGGQCEDIMEVVRRQKETLEKEVRKYCEERGVAAA
ncbi:indoleamine 2,3-dioxygenase-like protein [Coniochaeta ligniaria NRRL 30616]|uniref:Indoleamine 2,3-dioxygenase-like protein n=1 Tax=Coniochaeta ligniaria NRRL 30616 TaxID=1408157 RepID=A0A1J7I7F2_9PEZI|nr:indoleamine 2,3-dioxygenase-like protein [Coniochaeta ligniaria NRRL 30616]